MVRDVHSWRLCWRYLSGVGANKGSRAGLQASCCLQQICLSARYFGPQRCQSIPAHLLHLSHQVGAGQNGVERHSSQDLLAILYALTVKTSFYLAMWAPLTGAVQDKACCALLYTHMTDGRPYDRINTDTRRLLHLQIAGLIRLSILDTQPHLHISWTNVPTH